MSIYLKKCFDFILNKPVFVYFNVTEKSYVVCMCVC